MFNTSSICLEKIWQAKSLSRFINASVSAYKVLYILLLRIGFFKAREYNLNRSASYSYNERHSFSKSPPKIKR